MRLLASLFGQPDQRRLTLARLNAAATAAGTWRDFYQTLLAYYYQNGTYAWLSENLHDQGTIAEALKGIRTPAFRIVQFYVDHLWPGSLDDAFPVETDNSSIIDPMHQVWEWSNWESEKDTAALQLALYGDLFVRVTQPDDRGQVYFELVPPRLVTDFTEERGYLKEIRIDVPVAKVSRPGEPPQYITDPDWQQIESTAATAPDALTHTEVWSKYRGDWRRWEHRQGLNASLTDLGTPTDEAPLSEFGLDFVPFVHAQFGPSEEKRGASVLVPGLDKFDELNRKATRHSQIMFRHINRIMHLERAGVDQAGRPVPPPQVANSDGMIVVGDESFLGIPGGWTLKQTIANLDYGAYLQTIESEEAALAQDFPEMLWVRRNSGSDMSGRALRFLLAPAIKRVERARGNAVRALIRAMMMALSVGQASGLFTAGMGSYEDGRLAHTYGKRDVLPHDSLEDAQAELAEAQADQALKDLGIPLRMILEKRGYSQDDIAIIEAEAEKRAAEMQAALATPAAPASPVNGLAAATNGAPGTNGMNGQFGRR